MQWVTMNGRIGAGAWGGLNSYWVSPQIVRATAPAAAASPPRCCCLERAKPSSARPFPRRFARSRPYAQGVLTVQLRGPGDVPASTGHAGRTPNSCDRQAASVCVALGAADFVGILFRRRHVFRLSKNSRQATGGDSERNQEERRSFPRQAVDKRHMVRDRLAHHRARTFAENLDAEPQRNRIP